ncbi:MAG TPA: cytochrome P450 [Acidimicrobiales bacterium]|jgi:cytochrome P450|nr:cytochrome P450 [Acidimicrobiales bacterium]
MTALVDLGIDPAAPGFFLRADYYDVLARLRAESPVFEFAPGMKAVSRYHDIRELSRHPERFCSGRGVLVNDPLREGGTIEGSILHMDPPRHREWRAILNREFTPRAVSGMEERIRARCRHLLDDIPGDEVVDLVEVLAAPLPVQVICDLLGVADEARSDFRRWSDATILASDSTTNLPPDALDDVMELLAFLEQLATEKRATPADDIVSLLAGTEIEGRPMSPGELVTFNMSLLVAGNETTRHLISGGLLALAEHPDQRAALVADPSGIATAVEECLRWVTPIQQFARTATCATKVGDEPVAEGDYLVMLYASGNRDEAAFGTTAATFDAARPIAVPNLAFGFGEHLCLGAALARLEARVLFEEVLARFPTYEVTGAGEWLPSSLVRGPHSLPARFGPPDR